MKKYDSILFDLDGTLTDSGSGITNCAAYAMDTLGIDYSGKDLSVFVGPPLRKTFLEFNVPEELVEQAIEIYRSRYTTIGKFENIPYKGIEDVLVQLNSMGYKLYIATSKPEPVSKEIIEHFGLTKYFTEIAGASLDASRESKSAVIDYLLKKHHIDQAIMIGDTEYDVIGSKQHNIPCIGVSWGYGSISSMKEAGAIRIVDTMDELLSFFKI